MTWEDSPRCPLHPCARFSSPDPFQLEPFHVESFRVDPFQVEPFRVSRFHDDNAPAASTLTVCPTWVMTVGTDWFNVIGARPRAPALRMQ
jgi:hypothetical protein